MGTGQDKEVSGIPDGGPEKRGCGTLYVVSTPIGNLEDITLRALRILKGVNIIAAENVKHTRGLCAHYGIKTRVTAYNQHNRKARTPELIRRLQSGQDLALVTDAGTPGISDPGVYLVSRAAAEGVDVRAVPGPAAVTAALSVSGFPTERFLFLGFLPNRPGKRKKALEELCSEPRTTVFYEAPHRVKATLSDVMEVLGDRDMVLVREMTKVFEEIQRGPVSRILKGLTQDRIRGEFTLVLAGADQKGAESLGQEALERMERLLKENEMTVGDIARSLSREEGLPYRRIYRVCLDRKRDLQRLNGDGVG